MSYLAQEGLPVSQHCPTMINEEDNVKKIYLISEITAT